MLHAANDNSIRHKVEPRLVPAAKAARRLHLTAPQFAAKLRDLIAAGFPGPCPVVGHFDLVAIDAWLDRQFGVQVEPADDFETRLARLG